MADSFIQVPPNVDGGNKVKTNLVGDINTPVHIIESGNISVNNFPSTQNVVGATEDGSSPTPNFLMVGGMTAGGVAQLFETNNSGHLNIADGGGSITIDSPQLTSIDNKIPSLGQALMASSSPVTIASNQSAIPTIENATVVIGQSAQTAIVNNILTTTAGTAATPSENFRSATVQIISTGTAGTYIFEQSNDDINYRPLPVFNAELITAVPITGAITATASQIIYTFPVRCRFVRLRIVSTITGGSIQAFSRFSSDPWTASAQLIGNNTAANLQATVSGTVTSNIGTGTLAAVTSANLGIPSIIVDVASAALTTTTTTAAFTPTFGTTYIVNIPVTAVTGTTPTLDVIVQESDDTGTNWFDVYHFPRITATGIYRSPPLTLRGNRVRYVQTVGGTTPSFTRAINRLQRSDDAPLRGKFIDRTIAPNTINTFTPTYFIEGLVDFNLAIRCTAQTTAATVGLQFSDDGVNFITTDTAATVVGISILGTTNKNFKFARGFITVAGSGITLGELTITGSGK